MTVTANRPNSQSFFSQLNLRQQTKTGRLLDLDTDS